MYAEASVSVEVRRVHGDAFAPRYSSQLSGITADSRGRIRTRNRECKEPRILSSRGAPLLILATMDIPVSPADRYDILLAEHMCRVKSHPRSYAPALALVSWRANLS